MLERQMQFYSRAGEAEWALGSSANLEWSDGGLHIRQTAKYSIARRIRFDELEGVGEVSEFAIGRYGRLYLLDEDCNLWIYDQENRYHELLFPYGHRLFSKHARLSIIGETLIVADLEGESSCTAYAISNGQTHWRVETIEGLPLMPLALAVDERHVYTVVPLDCDTDSASGRQTVPAGGRLAIAMLGSGGEVVRLYQHERLVVKEAARLEYLRQRFFCAIGNGGQVYLFDAHEHILYAFSAAGELLTRMHLPALRFAGMAVDASNQIYIGDSRTIEEEGEDDRFILQFGATGELLSKVSGFRGKTDKLLLDRKSRMYVLNNEERTVTVLELQPRTMEREDSGRMEGVWLSQAFDSAEAETVWHRLTLDARIPEETQISVSYFASDRDSVLIGNAITPVDSFLARTDLSVEEKSRALAPYWSSPITNPTDALLFQAQGRYLWMKLEWIGSERKTPLLQRLRVYFPRQSYLSYLPALYQEDPVSKDFTERFLSLFGTLFDSVEQQIADMARQFDYEVAQGEHLRWLASWLGIEVDEHWSEEQVRRFVRDAPELYRYRGTRRGIAKMVEIYTGEPPLLVEYFQYRAMRERTELRLLMDRLYGAHPGIFTVLVKPEQVPTELHRQMLQQLLDEQKPAFTEARLILLEPWMYLDMHTYIGINTILTEPSLMMLDPKLSIPTSTLIVDVDREHRMDVHTRLGVDSELE